jgi:photosystem II stability/assembly factor-like uncharacterized protein
MATVRGGALCVAAAALLLMGCDDDPNEPAVADLTGDVSVTPDTVGVQDPIKVLFNRPVNPATALDPANFVVTNLCDTLRVPGSIRLAGDTLIFSPSQTLPFLSLLSIRVQNILDANGLALRQPITFQRITVAPPVSDVSWSFLNSPTNDFVSGINFTDQQVGYITTLGGAVYRTVNGGLLFGARFKDPNITETLNVQAFGPDTVVMIGSVLVGGSPKGAVFRSVDGGLTFQASNTVSTVIYASQFRRVGGNIVGVVGGATSTSVLYRYDFDTNQLTQASGTPHTGQELTADISLSPDGSAAVATFFNFINLHGTAFSSLDGGVTYSQITLPTDIPNFSGSGFVDNSTALLLGDSSLVIRVDVNSGAATRLGAAQGVPQTDVQGGATTVFNFRRARFAPGGAVGFITGSLTRRLPGTPDVVQGVVLHSDDGGQTWERQAIEGAPENGLAFPSVLALQVLSNDFALLGGDNGLVAVRPNDNPQAAAACSFSSQP